MEQDNPSKVFYRVGEVSQLVGVESYVLRYWEKMFPQLNPEKDEAGQRVYTRDDINLILSIKNLLYEERYTIDGARKRLKKERGSRKKTSEASEESRELAVVLREVKAILYEVKAIIEK